MKVSDTLLARWLLIGSAAILALVPFHATLTVWLAGLGVNYTAVRLWKEVLLAVLFAGAMALLFRNEPLRKRLDGNVAIRRISLLVGAYVLLHVVIGGIALLREEVNLLALGYALISNLRFLAFFLVAVVVGVYYADWLKQHWQKLLLWPALVVVAFGLLQEFVLPYDFLRHLGYGPETIEPYIAVDNKVEYARLQSTLRGPNPLGAYMVIAVTALATLFIVHIRNYLKYAVALAASVTVLFGTYSRSAWIGMIVSFGVLAWVFWEFITVDPIFPAKLVPIYGFVFGFLFLVLFRTIARAIRTILFRYNVGITHVLLVGNTDIAAEIAQSLKNSRRSGYHVIGIVGDKRRAIPADFASFDEALEVVNSQPLHAIIQTELYADEAKNQEILEYAQTHHISYRFVPGNTELFVGNIDVELFRSSVPMIAVHQTALLGWGRIVKRLFDFAFGLLLLVLASPLILLIALLTKLTTRGSVFFRQTRLTRFNNEFRVFKFRTQYAHFDGTTPEEAFAMLGKPELAKKYREQGDQLETDPRVTPLGRFLRATSLDELPQLINVVKGDISLVGPRALIPQELDAFGKKHAILSVKSGVTGLAQVSGRRNISFEERRKLDLYYVQNWSFWLDVTILFKTIRVILAREGAK